MEFLAEKLKVEVSRFKVRCDILRARIVDRFYPGRGASYQHLRIQAANHEAQAAYQPVPYDGRITLFRPKVHYREFNDPYFGWEGLAMQGVQIVEMPNYPRGSLNQPFVDILARRLTAEIEKTLHAPGGRPKAMIMPREHEESRLVG